MRSGALTQVRALSFKALIGVMMVNELWRRVWREGLVPLLSTASLEHLADILMRDDDRLIQGVTISPPALDVFEQHEVEAGCFIVLCAVAEGNETVGQAFRYFERMCLDVDEILHEPGICRYFLDWFDATPRRVMRGELLQEVQDALARREPVLQMV